MKGRWIAVTAPDSPMRYKLDSYDHLCAHHFHYCADFTAGTLIELDQMTDVKLFAFDAFLNNTHSTVQKS